MAFVVEMPYKIKMKSLTLLKRIFSNISNRKGRKFKHTSSQIKYFIDSFDEPKDDIERSYYQYLCQKWDTNSMPLIFLSNFAAFLLIAPYLLFFCLRKRNRDFVHYDAVLTQDFIKNHLPPDFRGSWFFSPNENGMLNANDLKFLFKIFKRYPFSFYFLFKVLCKIAMYSEMIMLYSPKTVFCSSEYSFTCSILTYYCETKNVSHINIMHGEKQLNPREAFSRFTVFYVWDDYYRELFIKLRANKTKYIVDPIKVPICDITKRKHGTYYLQLHTKKELLAIKNTLEKLPFDYSVRPHPIYSTSIVEEIFDEKHIEPNSVDIWTSICESGYVISQDSTVLYQAYLLGANVVIDDVSNEAYYHELVERGYIMITKEHSLLSSLLKDCDLS